MLVLVNKEIFKKKQYKYGCEYIKFEVDNMTVYVQRKYFCVARIVLYSILTLSSNAEMPMPEAAPVPASPKKGRELTRGRSRD